MNQDGLSGLQSAEPMEHLVSGDVVENQADRLSRIQICWNGYEVSNRNDGVLRVATYHDEGGDALPDREALHTRTEGVDFAHDVVAGRKRKPRYFRVETMAHQYVCVSYAGSKILDADLPG